MTVVPFEGQVVELGGPTPRILMPVLSLGNPGGASTLNLAALQARLMRAVVLKSGSLQDISVLNMTEEKGKLRAAIYDTGQASPNVFTLLGKGAAILQGESLHVQSLGDLGKPALVAGQHVMMAIATDTGGTAVKATFSGPVTPLLPGYLPGLVGGILETRNTLVSLDFPATLPEEGEPAGVGAHLLGLIA